MTPNRRRAPNYWQGYPMLSTSGVLSRTHGCALTTSRGSCFHLLALPFVSVKAAVGYSIQSTLRIDLLAVANTTGSDW